MVFAHKDIGVPIVQGLVTTTISISVLSSSKVLISKLCGEVSRINRGGYNLQEKLGWQLNEYEEIWVSLGCILLYVNSQSSDRLLLFIWLKNILPFGNHGAGITWTA